MCAPRGPPALTRPRDRQQKAPRGEQRLPWGGGRDFQGSRTERIRTSHVRAPRGPTALRSDTLSTPQPRS
eukprot:3158255-Pyramimonas_sp.AAC.1